ncbi:sensor histidine kinase [Geothrix sp. 21YS21S-2]|uniref:sensor histidine kinase n=1 Tax=Geothrix sp. 21YS21S-2 TaxID=3068893 RepID=UPI0027B8FAAE|nr:sensor histidine kinase [Geothrix sp. 21YS21S-2]
MSIRLTSLRSRILAWLLVPLAGSAGLGILLSRRDAAAMATVVQDRLLLGSARTIAQQISYEDGIIEVAIPPSALELFQGDTGDRVYYRIASSRGVLLSGYAEVPAPPGDLRPEESLHFTTRVRNEPVRVVAYAQPVFGAPGEGPVVIEVAETFQAHDSLAQRVWLGNIRQELLTLSLVAVLVWLALRGALKSILLLRDRVQERHAGSLEPLDPGPVPTELQPLVGAINGYVERLDTQMAVRSRFIANAAHQLRTPFTVLQTQVNFGLRNPDPAQKDQALTAIFQGVRAGTRLVNQLLSLSRAEASFLPFRNRVDVAALAQRVLEEQAALAQSKDMDLGLEVRTDQTEVPGSSSMLHELLANLVDNALHYTQAGGVVTVSVDRPGVGLVLKVEDNGPGIPEADRQRVFERFCRLQVDGTQGCGLGLSIAQEVTHALGGVIELSDPKEGTGLVVTVTFP